MRSESDAKKTAAQEAKRVLEEQQRIEEEKEEIKYSQDGKLDRNYFDKLSEKNKFDPHEYFIKGDPSQPDQACWTSIEVHY